MKSHGKMCRSVVMGWVLVFGLFFSQMRVTHALPQQPQMFAFYTSSYYEDSFFHFPSDWQALALSTHPGQLRPSSSSLAPDYDPLSVRTRMVHRQLAAKYGINGFIYQHYWSYAHGKPIYDGVIQSVLQEGEPNIPFFLAWNLRNLTNYHDDLLIPQECPHYFDFKIKDHYEYLRSILLHPLYYRIHGLPVLLVQVDHPLPDSCRYVIDKIRALLMQHDNLPYPALHLMSSELSMSQHPLYTPPTSPPSFPPTPPEQFHMHTNLYYSSLDLPEKDTIMPSYCMQGVKQDGLKPQALGVVVEWDVQMSANLISKHPSLYTLPKPYFGMHSTTDHSRIWSRENRVSKGDKDENEGDVTQKSFEKDLLNAYIYLQCCTSPDLNSYMILIHSWNDYVLGRAIEPTDRYSTTLLEGLQRVRVQARDMKCQWNVYKEWINEEW
ncbi:hypothetical protein EON65_32315 [archaeon]|nr:MAG: hypothetical protein EON65_32315 [archaeon]